MISRILDRLYVGDSNFTERDLNDLRITRVINVGGVNMDLPVPYFHQQLSDDGNNPEWVASTILALLRDGLRGRVLVCCRAGQSRSVYIIVKYLMEIGMGQEEAYSFVKAQHPVAQINSGLWGTI